MTASEGAKGADGELVPDSQQAQVLDEASSGAEDEGASGYREDDKQQADDPGAAEEQNRKRPEEIELLFDGQCPEVADEGEIVSRDHPDVGEIKGRPGKRKPKPIDAERETGSKDE